MPVEVCPADPSDLDTLTAVYQRAFSSSIITTHGFAQAPPASLLAWLQTRFLKYQSQPEYHIFKAIDTSTGEIAGWIRWVYPHTPSTKPPPAESEGRWPAGSNATVLDAFFGGLDAMRKKWVAVEDMYVVELLAVDPAYQRRGVGTSLLRQGLKMADEEGKKVYLEATKAGKPLYERLGWRVVDLLAVDLGEGKVEENCVMIREPHGGEVLKQ